ncbi:MAG: GGDEF domain-containing protein [Lachnospiraceae bacterium]|nr:GGDEF domain-containing protein [Lachnospiraceae bacterium]
MADIKILACKLGKHEWRQVPVPGNQFEMFECTVCKKKKYGKGGEGGGSSVSPAPAAGSAPAAAAASAAPAPAIETDEMTGFMNKGGALNAISTFLKANKSDNYTLCMCDIDNFRNLNETQGEKCGNIILREVASILKTEIGNMGTPTRWGGDEFLLLFPGKNGDEVYNLMFTMREKIKSRVVFFEGDGVSVTMTFGLAEYDFSGNIDNFVGEAEEKCNLGKQMGGDQVIF